MILYKRSSSRTWTPSVSFLQQCLSLEWHIFKRLIWQILALALPGVIISTVLTAAVFKYDFESLKNSKAFFTRCLTFLQNIACSQFLFSAFTTTARSPQVVAVSRCTSLGLERSSSGRFDLVSHRSCGGGGLAQRARGVWTAHDSDGGRVLAERRYYLRHLSGIFFSFSFLYICRRFIADVTFHLNTCKDLLALPAESSLIFSSFLVTCHLSIKTDQFYNSENKFSWTSGVLVATAARVKRMQHQRDRWRWRGYRQFHSPFRRWRSARACHGAGVAVLFEAVL